jgi:hypothetical protein
LTITNGATGPTYITTNNIVISTYINAFYINPNGSNYNISLDATLYNSTACTVTLGTGGNTAVFNVTIHILSYDATYLDSTNTIFYDKDII